MLYVNMTGARACCRRRDGLGVVGKFSRREQLICAKLAIIPFVGWAKAAACVALIGTKCALECQ
jgi:hypothetical protein